MKISRRRTKKRAPVAATSVIIPDAPAVNAPIPEEPPVVIHEDPEGGVEMDPLPEGWEYLNKEGLQDQCRERKLSDEGYKSELKDRLQGWQDKYFPEG